MSLEASPDYAAVVLSECVKVAKPLIMSIVLGISNKCGKSSILLGCGAGRGGWSSISMAVTLIGVGTLQSRWGVPCILTLFRQSSSLTRHLG